MINRRHVLLVSAASALVLNKRLAFAKAAQPATQVNFEMPINATDCHTHIHGDREKFPLFAGRVYTPELASPEEMAALHEALGIKRVVIVTPSIYGTDNSATLFGMKARGNDARGVAVIDDKTTEPELDAMGAAGIRGIRINLATSGVSDPAIGKQRLLAAIERMTARDWHIQMFTSLSLIPTIKDIVVTAPMPLVFDHFGGAIASLGTDQPGFAELLQLVKAGKAYVKISGAYRASSQVPEYADVTPLAKALIAANPERIIWGTDWPHPNSVTPLDKMASDVTPLYQIDDGRLLNQLAVWAPDAAIRKKILVENPNRLYDF